MADPVLTQLARRLRAERRNRGWTLAALAGRCGVSTATLSKVENGRMGLGYENLVRVAKALGIPVTDLFESTARNNRRSFTDKQSARRVFIPGYDFYYFASDVLQKRLVPMLVKVKARTVEEAGGLKFHKGEEVYYVVSGTAVLHTSDYAPLKVRAGQCIFMDGETGHAFTAGSRNTVIFSVNEGYPVYLSATGALFDEQAVALKPPRQGRAHRSPGLPRPPRARAARRGHDASS